MKIKDARGFLTKVGWEEAERMGKLVFTEEHRMIGLLLIEIKRRDILLENIMSDLDYVKRENNPNLITKILEPNE